MFTFVSIALLLVFIANVLAGALGNAQFLGDTGEMLLLLCASAAFVVVALKHEAAAKDENNPHDPQGGKNGS